LFSLDRVSPGTPALVTAPGYVPVCRFVKESDYSGGKVVLRQATGIVRLRLSGSSGQPVGAISGLPGSECPVPLSAFKVAGRRDSSGQLVEISPVPAGRFTVVTASGHSVAVQVPGTEAVPFESGQARCAPQVLAVEYGVR
jgi:hypothetical protein